MGVAALKFYAAFLLGKKSNPIDQPTKDHAHWTTPSREEVIAARAGRYRLGIHSKIELILSKRGVLSYRASRAQAANELDSCRADEAVPVA